MHGRETLKTGKLPFKTSDLFFQECLAAKHRFQAGVRLTLTKCRTGRDSPVEHGREDSTGTENHDGGNSDDACKCGSHEPLENARPWWVAKFEDCRPQGIAVTIMETDHPEYFARMSVTDRLTSSVRTSKSTLASRVR